MGHQVAQDTFVAELSDGPLAVQKGQVFPDGHEVVSLDAGRGLLFKPLDEIPDAPRTPRPRKPRAAKVS